MPPGDGYRAKAAEFAALLEATMDPELRAEYGRMAAAYRRLAEAADRNADATGETPPDQKSATE